MKRILLLSGSVVACGTIAAAAWLVQLDQNIQRRLAEKRFAPPVEFFSAPERIFVGVKFPSGYLQQTLIRRNFRLRQFGQAIQSGDYSLWSAEQCATLGIALIPKAFLKSTEEAKSALANEPKPEATPEPTPEPTPDRKSVV